MNADIQGSRLVLDGRIDDHAGMLTDVLTRLPAGDITIDTSGITFVNSIGMREWMRFVRALRQRGAVTLERVADVLMTQMNMIPEFAGNVRITSFHAQYVCGACGAETAPLIDAIANLELLRTMKTPSLPCPECGAQMDLADFPERYLSLFR